MEFINCTRGGVKLCYEGYSYTKKAEKTNRIRWECSQRKTASCKGAVTTSLLRDDLHVTVPHNHMGDVATVDAEKVKATMRDRVRDVRARPGQVLAAGITAASQDVRLKIGRVDSVRRTLRRQRRGALPAEPATLADVNITGKWTETTAQNPQPFLIFDSGTTSAERVLIFSSPEQLRHLAMADRWFMDGNFSMSPSQFQQLYVIRAPLGESAVSCVYALLSDKSQSIYETLLKAVVDNCDAMSYSVDPTTVVCDFEQAAINAVTAVLGSHVNVQGCFYHLTQSTWRKVQELGLKTAYKDDDNVKHFCGMLDALAFLPLNDITEGMNHIRQNIPTGNGLEALVDLVDYFDATYVTGSIRRIQRPVASHLIQPLRIRRTPPLFPPSLWNVHDVTLAGADRTNNLCESWNCGFASLVGHNHPSLWTLVEALQQDEALATTAIAQEARGQPPVKRVKRSTQQLQSRLLSLCVARRDNKKTATEMLEGLGYIIRF